MRTKLLRLLAAPWFITAAALLFRILYLVYRAHLIPAEVLASAPFENEVGNIAAALARGDGFCCVFRQPTGPTAWVAPIYPLLLAAVFRLFGTFTLPSFYAAVALNAVFSSLACIPLYSAARRVGGSSLAVRAAWLWALSPTGLIIPYAWIWDTSLAAFLAALLLWLTLRLPDTALLRDYVIYGFAWAFALLTNPSLGALLPFLFGWAVFRMPAQSSVKVKFASVTLAVILLCCLPWTIRNYAYFHRLIPLRSNFAFEFWSGNNEIFNPNSRAVNRITRYEQTHLYASLGENSFFDDKWQKASSFVRSNPGLYLQLCAQRVLATWLGSDSPWEDFRLTDSSLARFLLAWNALTLFLMVAGLIRLFQQRSANFLPIASFPLIFPLAFYLAHTSLRHRHPIDPVIALLVAIAIVPPQTLSK
ncbi:MAG TPA: glycosyltransferase family 39 protein [Methylomirabilota bacterium]|nr:glycosyltransferase family 39 protein [Methylomirabilota bacterium]